MMNMSASDLTGSALSATANVNSGLDLLPMVVGLLGMGGLLVALIFFPKHLMRIIYGYIGIAVAGVGLLIIYNILKAAPPMVEGVGYFILDYWPLILISLPITYYVGYKIETTKIPSSAKGGKHEAKR